MAWTKGRVEDEQPLFLRGPTPVLGLQDQPEQTQHPAMTSRHGMGGHTVFQVQRLGLSFGFAIMGAGEISGTPSEPLRNACACVVTAAGTPRGGTVWGEEDEGEGILLHACMVARRICAQQCVPWVSMAQQRIRTKAFG